MLDRHLTGGSWREYYCDLPVDPETTSLCIRNMTAWATVIGEKDGIRTWIVWHDITRPGLEPGQLAWSELPLPTDIIGEITSILDVDMTNRYIIIQYGIPFPTKFDGNDQSSSEHIYKRKAIISWDIQDISRAIPLYIQPDNEVRDHTIFPYLMNFYTYWALGFTQFVSESQPDDISFGYVLYDLKRMSCYSFDSVYTSSHAYIQYATEDYAQVITLHCKLDDMEVEDEDLTMTDGKPTDLRVQWHSYIFDDEHSTNLENYSGEIIISCHYDNPIIYGQVYGPGLSLIVIYDATDSEVHSDGSEPHVILALIRVPNHTLPQNNVSLRRRSRYDGDIGEVIWTQLIATETVMPLYSQNLIVVKEDNKIDILSGTDGKIVRQFDCAIHGVLGTIIGPYCHFLDRDKNGFIVNIETGETFRCSNKVRSSKKCRNARSVEGTHVANDNSTVEDTSTAKELHLLDGTTFSMIAMNETDEVDNINDFSESETASNADTSSEDPSLTDQPTRTLATSCCWPFCNSFGGLAIDEPEHRNRFYLYRLCGF